jgi:FKBP-type peptidyl-prolyl cis-trans isomerase SlyD
VIACPEEDQMTIQNDAVATIAYTLKDDDGQVLDTSEDHGDLAYLHGHQNIVPGLEEALEGKGPGESVQATIPPEKAYGARDEQLIFQVPRERMPEETELQVGMQFEAQSSGGERQIVTLADVGDAEVTLDANHPLAGQTLHFEVTINDVREATSEELDHGHVH